MSYRSFKPVVIKQTQETPVNKHGHKYINAEEICRLWEKSQENIVICAIREGKDLAEVIGKERMQRVFSQLPCCLGCSDGRIHEHRAGRAGMGIVAGIDETVEELKKFLDENPGKEPFLVKSHFGCGAAKIVCDKLIAEGKLPVDAVSDDLGIEFAKKVVANLKESGYNVKYSHTESKEMDNFHDERVIYFDGTGKIDIEEEKNENEERFFPEGYIFSDVEPSEIENVEELKALCNIALGDHGFGKELFTKEDPFVILICAKDKNQLEELKTTAKKATKGFNGKVKVEGFVVA